MTRMSNQLKYAAMTVVILLSFSVAVEPRAHAYVDPGSSLMFFQTLSAIVTGALFYGRRRLKALFTRKEAVKPEVTQEQV